MAAHGLSAAFAVLFAVALVAPSALADPPRARDEADKTVLANEHVTVWFQGKKPMLKVFETGNDTRAFHVFLKEIVELQGVGAGREEVSTLRLARAQAWNVTVDEGAENGTAAARVTMRLSDVPRFLGNQQEMLNLPPQVQERLRRDASPANVTLTFHVYEQATVATGMHNATANVTAYEVKWDLHVEDWPWVNEANRLAIRFQVRAAGFGNETQNLTDEGEEGVAVSGNGTAEPIGAVTWSETATVVRDGDANNTNVSSMKFETGKRDGNGHSFLLVFDALGGYDELSYDPSMSIVPSTEPTTEDGKKDKDGGIPGFGLPLLVLGAGAALAWAAVRRRR